MDLPVGELARHDAGDVRVCERRHGGREYRIPGGRTVGRRHHCPGAAGPRAAGSTRISTTPRVAAVLALPAASHMLPLAARIANKESAVKGNPDVLDALNRALTI